MCEARDAGVPHPIFQIRPVGCLPSVPDDAEGIQHADSAKYPKADAEARQRRPGRRRQDRDEQGRAEVSHCRRSESAQVPTISRCARLRKQGDDNKLQSGQGTCGSAGDHVKILPGRECIELWHLSTVSGTLYRAIASGLIIDSLRFRDE